MLRAQTTTGSGSGRHRDEIGHTVGPLPYARGRGRTSRARGRRAYLGRRSRCRSGPAAWTGTVSFAGGGLHDLPAAVPVPGHRPAARAAQPGRRAGHAGARGAGAAVRPARRRADAGGGPAPCSQPEWDRLLGGRARAGHAVLRRRDDAGGLAGATRTRPVDSYFTLEDPRRLEPADRELYVEATAGVRAAAARLHRPARRGAGRRDPGGRLQDRQGPARRTSRRGPCSR